jgi:hypothetical protein
LHYWQQVSLSSPLLQFADQSHCAPFLYAPLNRDFVLPSPYSLQYAVALELEIVPELLLSIPLIHSWHWQDDQNGSAVLVVAVLAL